jgi:hypothetical protein
MAVSVPLSVTPRRGDWTPQELCELDRIRARCSPRSTFELQCSQTDEGDPWCIVYDREREQVVVHLARVDDRYVMARTSHTKLFTASSLSAAVNVALDELHRAGCDFTADCNRRTPIRLIT